MNVKKISKLALTVNVLLCVVAFSQHGWAQSSDSNVEPNVDETATRETQKKETQKSKSKPKIFRPSEEISEDLPVPFPVDI